MSKEFQMESSSMTTDSSCRMVMACSSSWAHSFLMVIYNSQLMSSQISRFSRERSRLMASLSLSNILEMKGFFSFYADSRLMSVMFRIILHIDFYRF